MADRFILSLVSGLAKALCIALLMAATNLSVVFKDAFFAAVIAAVFMVTSLGYYNGFARAPSKLTLINSEHSIVELTIMGAIIGAIA